MLGLLCGGFGGGALLGARLAQQLSLRVDLPRLAAAAILAMPLPLFLLSPHTPWPAAMAAVGAFGFCAPLVNAPVVGMLTVRTPVELRPKVMTAVLMVATLAGPLGFLGSGLALRHVSLSAFFLVVPALLLLASLGMAAVLLRDPGAAPDDLAMPDVAHGQA